MAAAEFLLVAREPYNNSGRIRVRFRVSRAKTTPALNSTKGLTHDA
jgi:hypothetical protein